MTPCYASWMLITGVVATAFDPACSAQSTSPTAECSIPGWIVVVTSSMSPRAMRRTDGLADC